MPEAVVRVARTAGEISRTIGQVSRETQELVEELRGVDDEVAAATKALGDYRRLIQQGVPLSPQQAQSFQAAGTFLRQKGPARLLAAGPPTQATARALERVREFVERPVEVSQRPSDAPPPARPTAPPLTRTAAPPPPRPPRPLRGLSDADLEREERRLAREITRVERDVDRLVGDQTGAGAANLRQAALAADPARRELLQRHAALQAEREQRQAPEAPAADDALTPEERDRHRRLGMTEEQLERATRLRPGTILVRPAAPRAATTTEAALASPPIAGEGKAKVESATHEARVVANRTAEAAEDVTVAVGDQRQELSQLNREQRLTRMSALDLQRSWRDSTRAILEQGRELDRAESSFRRLRSVREHGIPLGRREAMTFRELPARMTDLREGLQGLHADRHALEGEVERRGGRIEDGKVMLGGGGGGRKLAGTFLAAAGAGGGSIGGTIAGGALGLLSPAGALATLGGLFVGKGIQIATRSYERHMEHLGRVLPLARATGVPANDILASTIGSAEQYKVFGLQDLETATTTLARGTGRADVGTSILPTASVTGQTATEEASRIAMLSRLSGRFDPELSRKLLGSFGESALARRRLRAGQPSPDFVGPTQPDTSLPFEATLYPQYAEQAARLAGATVSPFTRVPVDAMGEMLSMATRRLNVPGVDMTTVGGLDVAANVVQGANQVVSRPTGSVLDDLQFLAMQKLRGTPTAERLRAEHGIDLNSILGMRRAIRRAPELAARGIPEVAEGIFDTYRSSLDPRLLEAVLGDKYDPELAATMVSQPKAIIDTLRSGRGATRAGQRAWGAEDLAAAADGTAARSDVDQYFQFATRPEILDLQLATSFASQIGSVITAGMNDLRSAVQDELGKFFDSRGPSNAQAAAEAGGFAANMSLANQMGM